MQIAFENGYSDISINKEIEAMGIIEEYLLKIGLKRLVYDKSIISGEEQYTNLLVPPLSGIREKRTGIINNEEDKSRMTEIFIRKYGCLTPTPEICMISTTTAIMINEYLKGKIDENAFYSGIVTRKHEEMYELEILLANATLEEGEKLLMKIISVFIDKKREFVVNPTWFSWASMAENIREDKSKNKWGALGVVRPEIIECSQYNLSKKVIIIGVPIVTLAQII